MNARTIDWQAIHGRLAASATALAQWVEHSPEETRRVLQARARVAAPGAA